MLLFQCIAKADTPFSTQLLCKNTGGISLRLTFPSSQFIAGAQ